MSREELTAIPQENQKSACDNCRAEIVYEKFCPSCGFPVNGTDQEKSDYRAKIGSSKYWLKEAEAKINNAKMFIYVLAGLTFLMGIFQGTMQDDFVTMIVNFVICLIYLICAAWANKSPFGAILTCFIVYLTIQIISAIAAPASIFSGIIWKVIIIAAFVKGIRSASEAQKYIKELQQYKVHA
ncbi:MAG: hypothetical protein ACOYXT_09870 [Bacteroidota bacterium]